jgi:hypothetical protein
VKLLIGIASTQLAPKLMFSLPSGLCIYESKFMDKYGTRLCFGGPHAVFTQGYKKFGTSSIGTVQVLFSEIAEAYLHGPRTLVAESPDEEIADQFECRLDQEEESFEKAEHELLNEIEPAARSDAGPESDSLPSCYHFDKCVNSASCYKALVPLSKLKGLVDEWDISDVTDFRCDVCANCPNCKRSARERTKSLQEEHEQEVIEKRFGEEKGAGRPPLYSRPDRILEEETWRQ